ncbi:rhomboid family intramembrane serine protease [Novilysobacter arseniciresistens]|uniref:rhomboid family intramembrane serine protease n=1 Tax=Novilysobacter arseniciresistens TaxID=1385522 RepID=UPI00068FD3C9|nr:rhomboid family intramembrane serine protease [Lysobacter arseniciresistens]
MLILPLHRPINRATFPVVTVLLIIVNVLVFFGWQAGDDAAMQRASHHYVASGLAGLEVPAYERHLVETSQVDVLEEFRGVPDGIRGDYVAQRTFTDVAFLDALRSGALFDDAATLEAWRPLRADYDAELGEVFTLRHMLRSSEVDPWRMLAAAFLHGGVMHLVGNMLFLLALGLLVEGALGPGRYLALYLLGAVGSSAFSLMWRWGEVGGGLGASGAVAALMGAFCVVWGRQPVRFFYWLWVVFDYVRAPAILLLPAWLGWEVLNLNLNGDSNVGFDAHIGGLLAGALMGAVLVATGQVRQSFIRDDGGVAVDDRLARAQASIGRMQLVEADSLLEELAREQPGSFEIKLLRYRVARNGGRVAATAERAADVLAAVAPDADAIRAQGDVLAELHGTPLAPAMGDRLRLAGRWLEAGALDTVEAALKPVAGDDGAETAARLWFQLALARRDRHQDDAHRRALSQLVERYPAQPQAAKARFLLGEPEPVDGATQPAT